MSSLASPSQLVRSHSAPDLCVQREGSLTLQAKKSILPFCEQTECSQSTSLALMRDKFRHLTKSGDDFDKATSEFFSVLLRTADQAQLKLFFKETDFSPHLGKISLKNLIRLHNLAQKNEGESTRHSTTVLREIKQRKIDNFKGIKPVEYATLLIHGLGWIMVCAKEERKSWEAFSDDLLREGVKTGLFHEIEPQEYIVLLTRAGARPKFFEQVITVRPLQEEECHSATCYHHVSLFEICRKIQTTLPKGQSSPSTDALLTMLENSPRMRELEDRLLIQLIQSFGPSQFERLDTICPQLAGVGDSKNLAKALQAAGNRHDIVEFLLTHTTMEPRVFALKLLWLVTHYPTQGVNGDETIIEFVAGSLNFKQMDEQSRNAVLQKLPPPGQAEYLNVFFGKVEGLKRT